VLRDGLAAPAETDANADGGQTPRWTPDAPAAVAVPADHGVSAADMAVALPDEADQSGDGSAEPPRPDGEDLDDFLSGLGR
jgi:hypothetical protein